MAASLEELILPPPPKFRDPESFGESLLRMLEEAEDLDEFAFRVLNTPADEDEYEGDDFGDDLQQLFRGPEEFHVLQTDFDGWLNVWRMSVSPKNENRRDILGFTEKTMRWEARNVLESEIGKLGSVKASFGLEVKFKRERRNVNGEMYEEKQRHYFKEDQPHVFTKANFKETFNQKFKGICRPDQGRNRELVGARVWMGCR